MWGEPSCKVTKRSKLRVWGVVFDGLDTQNEYGASAHVAATPEFSQVGDIELRFEPQPKIWGSAIDAGTAGMATKMGERAFSILPLAGQETWDQGWPFHRRRWVVCVWANQASQYEESVNWPQKRGDVFRIGSLMVYLQICSRGQHLNSQRGTGPCVHPDQPDANRLPPPSQTQIHPQLSQPITHSLLPLCGLPYRSVP